MKHGIRDISELGRHLTEVGGEHRACVQIVEWNFGQGPLINLACILAPLLVPIDRSDKKADFHDATAIFETAKHRLDPREKLQRLVVTSNVGEKNRACEV